MEPQISYPAPGGNLMDVADEQARNEQVLARMAEQGVSTEEEVEVDYFDFHLTKDVYMPGSTTQYVTIRALTEGDRVAYLNGQSREMKVQKLTGDAIIKMQSGEERMALLRSAIVDWYLLRRTDRGDKFKPVQFNTAELNLFLKNANPKVIDAIEREVRKMNPWLVADASVEDIERQIEELNEMLVIKQKEEAGNAG